MKPISLSISCVLLLAGCQTVPDRLPQAEPVPAAACYFPAGSASTNIDLVSQSVAVLEEWGFKLDSTDTALGLVSASRQRELVGYYDPYDNAYGYGRGMRMFGGVGLGRGSGIGLGFGGGIGQQPVEVERVSLLVTDGYVRISRDIRRFDHLGDLRESYSASNDDFCQRFQSAFAQTPATGRAL
ncbi:hypothetical protein [Vreelandella olivaria]|uniref:hypothetical protein n=1 Tax=Vreelandella olivaria TaxID=390919 RepID=UPI00201ED583|nr:hypothetical protein [Halomonas olivaria]